MKRYLIVFLVGLLFLGGFCGTGFSTQDKCTVNVSISYVGDELDQYQDVNVSAMPVGRLRIGEVDVNFMMAQSFIPQKEVLTRVELFIGRNTTAVHDFVLGIRQSLTGADLVTASVPAGSVVELDYSWIEFDVADLLVDVGETYYLVTYTENVSENYYAWGANNDSESYPHGCAWVSANDGNTWTNESQADAQDPQDDNQHPLGADDPTWDMCFKTYGRDAFELDTTFKGGLGVNLDISNIGATDAENIAYSIQVTGGILGNINVSVEDTIALIEAGQQTTVGTGIFVGLGPIDIDVVVDTNEIHKSGIIILFFVLGVT